MSRKRSKVFADSIRIESASGGKEEIRRVIGAERSRLDQRWVEQCSMSAQEHVIKLPEFRKAAIVCCYFAMAGEVRTELILESCWKRGKTTCVPAFCERTGGYRLARIERHMPIVEGPWKILEPERKHWIAARNVDLFVVPGVAFDPFGGRLGHGGGHYDNLMGKAKAGLSCFKMGLAFDFQVLASVPMNRHDVSMDAIVTEKTVLRRGATAV